MSLGRATVDVNVDIDLAKEGHANKISRRQVTVPFDTMTKLLRKIDII